MRRVMEDHARPLVPRDASRAVAGALAIVALLTVVIDHWCYFEPAVDQVRQIGAAQNLLDGHGLTYNALNPRDVGKLWRGRVTGWPPGYSLLIAPLLYLFDEVAVAVVLLDAASAALFFWSWWRILGALGGRYASQARLLIWIWWGLAWNPLVGLTSTDLMSLAFFSAGVAQCVAALMSPQPVRAAARAACWAAAAAAIRFAYWPLALVAPAVLACGARLNRQRPLRAAAWTSLAVVVALLGLLAAGQHLLSGHVTYLSTDRHEGFGLHAENLLRHSPFLAYALGLPDVWTWLARRDVLMLGVGARATLWLVSALVAVALVPVVRQAWQVLVLGRGSAAGAAAAVAPQELRPPRFDAGVALVVAGALALALTVAMLGLLSLLAPADRSGEKVWTYVKETRYYAPALVFVSVGLAYSAVGVWTWLGCHARMWRAAALLLVTAAVVINGCCRFQRLADFFHASPGLRIAILEDRARMRAIRDCVRWHLRRGRPVVFVTEGATGASFHASMAGAGLLRARTAQQRLDTAQPVVLLALVHHRNRSAVMPIFRAHLGTPHGPRRVARWGGLDLYQCIMSETYLPDGEAQAATCDAKRPAT